VLLVFGVAPALAQDAAPVRPGDAALDTSHLRAGTDSLAVYILDQGRAVPIGRILLTTTLDGDRLNREEVFYGGQGEVVWSDAFTLERATLRPIRQRSEGPGAQALDFDGDAVRQRRGDATAEARLAAPVFYANAMDLLLTSLPLAEGFRAEIAVLDDDGLGERRLVVEVEGLGETREVTGVVRGTWTVRVGEGEAASLYHVDRATGALVRHDAPADGLVMVRW